MRFQVLSHAGLAVYADDLTLVCDPWLAGSTYWRAWWNYPPVPPELIAALKPDYIYITHVHWDHFHGPSLRRFDPATPVIVPRGQHDRMKWDLHELGFRRVIELPHGASLDLSPRFRLTSYQFGLIPCDSAVVIEADGTTLFNANDAKFMGLPLRQILRRHPRIDFVFRSHSSANSRLCFEVVDRPDAAVDDLETYIATFARFAQKTKATYAIPFASNHCYLHRDVVQFNETIQTPGMVEEYFRRHGIATPRVQVMVAGDAWSSDSGFHLGPTDYFSDRPRRLGEYLASRREVLERCYEAEAGAEIGLDDLERYFRRFFAAVPRPVRWLFRGRPILYVLRNGHGERCFWVDLHRQRVTPAGGDATRSHPIQIHTQALLMKQCVTMDMLSLLAISKRLRYRVTARHRKYVRLYDRLVNLFEYGSLPLRRCVRRRYLLVMGARWREVVQYLILAKDLCLGRKFDEARYLR
jgi:UDP-MurNAc hydroxylase